VKPARPFFNWCDTGIVLTVYAVAGLVLALVLWLT
jgi:hypothetical protein